MYTHKYLPTPSPSSRSRSRSRTVVRHHYNADLTLPPLPLRLRLPTTQRLPSRPINDTVAYYSVFMFAERRQSVGGPQLLTHFAAFVCEYRKGS